MESWVSFLADHGFNGVVAAAVANILAIWKDRIDYRLEYTTGNPDLIYAFAWLDWKKEGPTVLNMPPKLRGKHAA